jgi:hypothetical protein
MKATAACRKEEPGFHASAARERTSPALRQASSVKRETRRTAAAAASEARLLASTAMAAIIPHVAVAVGDPGIRPRKYIGSSNTGARPA